MALDLFARYDENGDGKIDLSELETLLKNLDRTKLEVSEDMIERFVQTELKSADADLSGKLDVVEFCEYISKLSRWARKELLEMNKRPQLVAVLVNRAVETTMPLAQPAADDGQPELVVTSRKYGLKLTVPQESLPQNDGRFSLQTLATHHAQNLHELTVRGGGKRMGEFPFTPLVRVNYSPGMAPGADFTQALELSMPHCFDPEDGLESVVMLGCRDGETSWKVIDALTTSDYSNPVSLAPDKMHVKIFYPGIFCAFSSFEVEDFCQVRLTVWQPPTVLPGRAFTLRVTLSQLLPNMLAAEKLHQQAEWGLSDASLVFDTSLCQGTVLNLNLQGTEQTLQWTGLPCGALFSCTPRTTAGSYKETLNIKIGTGVGRRASFVNAAAKRAGIPPGGRDLEFEINPRGLRPPPPPANVGVFQRSQWNVTFEWDAPSGVGILESQVAFEIELSTCGRAGTYRPFESWWEGEKPNDLLDERIEAAAPTKGATPCQTDTSVVNPTAKGDTGPRQQASTPDSNSIKQPARTYAKTLEAPHNLYGIVRFRCWCEGMLLPSPYTELKLERFKRKMEKKSPQRLLAEKAEEDSRKAEFEEAREWARIKQTQTTVIVGNAPLKRMPWQIQADLLILDTPLPAEPHVREAAKILGEIVEQLGDRRGIGGTICGLRVVHFVRAILLGRTSATIHEPLVALAEVLLADAIMPLESTLECLTAEWSVVLERLQGMVALLNSWKCMHESARPHVCDFLSTMNDVWEMLRHCQADMYISLNLKEVEYSAHLKRELEDEATEALVTLCWRLSTDSIKLLIHQADSKAQMSVRFGRSTLEQRGYELTPEAVINSLFKCSDPLHGKQMRKGFFGWFSRNKIQ